MNESNRIIELEEALNSIRKAVIETSAHTVIGSCIISSIDAVMNNNVTSVVENTYTLYRHSLISNVKIEDIKATSDDSAMKKASEIIEKGDSRSYLLVDHHRIRRFNYRDGEWWL